MAGMMTDYGYERELERLARRNDEVEDELHGLREELATLRDENDELEDRLENLADKLEETGEALKRMTEYAASLEIAAADSFACAPSWRKPKLLRENPVIEVVI